MDTSTMIWTISAFTAIVVWAVRQEGRINLNSQRHDDQDKKIAQLTKMQDEWKQEVRDQFTYLRESVDRIVGSHYRS